MNDSLQYFPVCPVCSVPGGPVSASSHTPADCDPHKDFTHTEGAAPDWAVDAKADGHLDRHIPPAPEAPGRPDRRAHTLTPRALLPAPGGPALVLGPCSGLPAQPALPMQRAGSQVEGSKSPMSPRPRVIWVLSSERSLHLGI